MTDKKVTKEEAENIEAVKKKYGFYLQGYHGRAYYWEIVVMFRKMSIVIATVIFSTLSSEMQILFVLFIVTVNLFA